MNFMKAIQRGLHVIDKNIMASGFPWVAGEATTPTLVSTSLKIN